MNKTLTVPWYVIPLSKIGWYRFHEWLSRMIHQLTPNAEYEMKISYDCEVLEITETDDLLEYLMKPLERGDSGCGCGVRDIWFFGNKRDMLKAIATFDTLYVLDGNYFCQVNTLFDYDFLGTYC